MTVASGDVPVASSDETGAGQLDTPALRHLREQVAAAKLRKELAEANAGRVKALLPDPTGVSLEKDEVAEGQQTGLSGVLMVRASDALADDIADLAQVALRDKVGDGVPVSVVVVGDTSLVDASGSWRLLELEHERLQARVAQVAGGSTEATGSRPAEVEFAEVLPSGGVRNLFAAQALPIIAQALPAAVGLLAKLTARSYSVAGQAASGLDDLGFDTAVASQLRSRRPSAAVRVDRIQPAPKSELLAKIVELAASVPGSVAEATAAAEQAVVRASTMAAQSRARLEASRARVLQLITSLTDSDTVAPAPVLMQLDSHRIEEAHLQAALIRARVGMRTPSAGRGDAEVRAMAATAEVLEEQLTQVRVRLTELLKVVGGAADAGGESARMGQLAVEREAEKRLEEELPGLLVAEGDAVLRRDELVRLRDDIETFLLSICSPPDDGSEAPLLRAVRAEAAFGGCGAGRFVLFARLLTGGVDNVFETRIGRDRQSVLAGAAAEFALIDATGDIIVSGVRSSLVSWESQIGRYDTLRESRPLDVGLPRATEARGGSISSTGG